MPRIDNRGNLRGSAANAGGIEVQGGSDFYALARHLKNAGEAELRKEFLKAMQTAAKPLLPKVREAARADLPKKGGLNERIAKKPYRVQTRTGARTAGVRIVGSKVDPRINQGRVYHPVFGRSGAAGNGGKNSVVQNVPQAVGYFDKTLQNSGADVQAAVLAAMQEWTRRLLLEGI